MTRSDGIQSPWSFTPDGTRLAYHETSGLTGFDLWTVPIRETDAGLTADAPEVFLRTPALRNLSYFLARRPLDRVWLQQSGAWEVYVRALPGNGTKVQVSTAGGRIPHWLNGRELLYRTDDHRIMAASCSAQGGSFLVHSVRPWSPKRLADTGVLSNFDLAPDGRIAALTPSETEEDRQLEDHVTFMLNFPVAIRQRMAGTAAAKR